MVKKILTEIGWREEIHIPSLFKYKIKAKIDTGALTSALHVTNMTFEMRHGVEYVSFIAHPSQHSSRPRVRCREKVVAHRKVKSSVGQTTVRPVIEVELKIGKKLFRTEITLVNRELMGFRMLVGRRAMKGRFLVNPGKSFLLRKGRKKS